MGMCARHLAEAWFTAGAPGYEMRRSVLGPDLVLSGLTEEQQEGAVSLLGPTEGVMGLLEFRTGERRCINAKTTHAVLRQDEGWEACREIRGPRMDRDCAPRHTAHGQPRLDSSLALSDCRSRE